MPDRKNDRGNNIFFTVVVGRQDSDWAMGCAIWGWNPSRIKRYSLLRKV